MTPAVDGCWAYASIFGAFLLYGVCIYWPICVATFPIGIRSVSCAGDYESI